MTKVKELWNKVKIWVGLVFAGVLMGYLVLRKHVGTGLEEQREQYKREEEAKTAADEKLKEETKKIEEKKQEEITKVQEDKKQKLKDAVVKAKEEKRRLEDEAKRDPQGFKIELNKELGVKEKKKKGKRK